MILSTSRRFHGLRGKMVAIILSAGGDVVTGAATVIKSAGAGRNAGIAIDKVLKDGEWWDPNAPKPAEVAWEK